MANTHDIARLAGVSQTTVSRVLRADPAVHPETRQRVLDVLTATNYRPNALARAMKTHQTGSIGVVVSRITYPLYPELLQLIGAELTQAGKQMVVWEASVSGEQAAYNAARQNLVDGIIFLTATPQTQSLYTAVRDQIPVVVVNRLVENCACDQVSSDNVGGAWQAAEYISQHGRRKVAIITCAPGPSTQRDREAGFRQGLAHHGLALQPGAVLSGIPLSYQGGLIAIRQLLQGDAPPDTVLCTNDLIALGAIDGARSYGVRVPQDLWVIGYDDIEQASWDAFDLTTVRQPLALMAHQGIQRLLARLSDRSLPHSTQLIKDTLVIRGSTAHAGTTATG